MLTQNQIIYMYIYVYERKTMLHRSETPVKAHEVGRLSDFPSLKARPSIPLQIVSIHRANINAIPGCKDNRKRIGAILNARPQIIIAVS